VAVFGLAVLLPAFARPATAQAPTPLANTEVWAGAEGFGRVWSLYSGATFAPFGPVQQDGFRVRGITGYGDYHTGTVSFADLLLGYHKQFGTWTIKFFGGLTAASHDATSAELDGPGIGGKTVLETWWNTTDHVWISTDLSYGSLHDSYYARVRAGWRFTPQLSIGLEGGAAGSLDTDIARGGGFLRYEWASGELSVSGGFAREGFDGLPDDSSGAYGTISVLTRF